MSEEQSALQYHEFPTPGKLATVPTKPCETVRDLSLAYSPGVAVPCLEIAKDQALAYRYTSKGNLVAVISNGTAVLGLGDIGPLASKPVMEGKGVLFKAFAGIDVFDIELACKDPKQFIETVAALEPTFGGINLEDIKAPECFDIEEQLKKRLDIPVFHDDQHGTAIIAGAGLLNALELVGKSIKEIRLVINGAGAAAVACGRLLLRLGLPRENLIMADSKGVLYTGRAEGMNRYKEEFVNPTERRTLAEALDGADVFFGLSVKGAVTSEMLLSMAENPIVFAMANPDPEIDYPVARAARPDVIVATGRSDYPNQVNNVLGFPYIFRGALDVRARSINEEMKMAAVYALAALAKESVHDKVRAAYEGTGFSFGPEYLIPKPFDPRVLYYVAPAVARAAIESGVARENIDIEEYTLRLKGQQNKGRVVLRSYYTVARSSNKKRIAFAEGANENVLKAAKMAFDESIAEPVLIGRASAIEEAARKLDVDLKGFQLIEPATDARYGDYVEEYYLQMQRKGITRSEAERGVRQDNIFANLLLSKGEVAGLICGVDRPFPTMMRPILQIIGLKEGVSTASALFLVSLEDKLFFFSDTAINLEMNSEKLASIALMSAEFAKSMNVQPRVAFLSFSNFGSVKHPSVDMISEALEQVKLQAPELQIDGEMQADTAVVGSILKESFPFSRLAGPANVLIFPDMQSANISFKLLQRLAHARVVGPIILGLKAPAYVMQQHAGVDEIFNMITVAVAQAALSVVQRGGRQRTDGPKKNRTGAVTPLSDAPAQADGRNATLRVGNS